VAFAGFDIVKVLDGLVPLRETMHRGPCYIRGMRRLAIATVMLVLAACRAKSAAATTNLTPTEVVESAKATIEDWRKAYGHAASKRYRSGTRTTAA
jgi:hypothetical protein